MPQYERSNTSAQSHASPASVWAFFSARSVCSCAAARAIDAENNSWKAHRWWSGKMGKQRVSYGPGVVQAQRMEVTEQRVVNNVVFGRKGRTNTIIRKFNLLSFHYIRERLIKRGQARSQSSSARNINNINNRNIKRAEINNNSNNTYIADISSLCILCNSEKKSDLSAAYLVLLKPLEETSGCLFILFTKIFLAFSLSLSLSLSLARIKRSL